MCVKSYKKYQKNKEIICLVTCKLLISEKRKKIHILRIVQDKIYVGEKKEKKRGTSSKRKTYGLKQGRFSIHSSEKTSNYSTN